MNTLSLASRVTRKQKVLAAGFYQKLRIKKYSMLSDATGLMSAARVHQPVLATGFGKISLGRCNLGVWPSPYFLNGYIQMEARSPEAEIVIGDGTSISNNASIIADRTRISIGKNTLIGSELTIYDSDFHEIHLARRMSGEHLAAPVSVGDDVFIGSRVTILKGVAIGDNSVIATGSVVSKNNPANSIASSSPARVIQSIDPH